MRSSLSARALFLVAATIITIGCAPENPGGSSDPPPDGGAKVAGSVVLPEGVAADELKVISPAGSGDVDTDGDFTVDLPAPSRPAFLLVQDNTGQVVLFGFMNSAGGTATVSPRDSVVALLFLGLGGYTLPPEFQEPLLGQIGQQPVVDTLTETLTGLLRENPAVLAEGNASFEAAVKAALPDLRALPGPSQKQARRTREIGPPLGSLTVFQQTQSGIDVVQAGGPGAVMANNSFRRRSLVYVYKTATQVKGGAKTPVSPAQRLGGPLKLDSTQNLGSLLGLFQQAIFVVTGTSTSSAFVPKSAGPIELPADPDAENTFFKVVTAGSGFYNPLPTNGNSELTDDPAFPQSERDEWIRIAEDYQAAAFFFDLGLPALDALCGGLITVTKPDISADLQIALGVIGELQNSFNLLDSDAREVVFPGSTVVPANFVALIAAGTWRPVADAMLRMMFTSPGAREAVFSRMSVQLSGSTIAFMESLGTVNTILNVAFAGGDFLTVLEDLGASQNINAWEIVVVRNRVVLTPEKTHITAGAEVEFSVEVPAIDDGQELTYEWSVSGAVGGTLSDADHQNQPSFESTSKSVTYNAPAGANPAADAQDLIKVKVFAVNGNVINEVGTDTSTVTFNPLHVTINPPQVTVPAAAAFADLLVEVEGAQPGARFLYFWQVPDGAFGVIEDQNGPVTAQGTEHAAVDYVLNGRPSLQPVTETLTVKAFSLNDDGSIRADIGSAQTEVTIQPEPCDDSNGTPVFTGCGLNSTWPSAVRMGEEMTITFKQQASGICGGNWTIHMNMPGQFISAPEAMVLGQSAIFPPPASETTRTAVYRLSDDPSMYDGLRTCPRGLGYYEFPSADTGPYIYITNGAHDLLPYVVNP